MSEMKLFVLFAGKKKN